MTLANRQTIKIGALLCIGLLLAAYLCYQLRGVVRGPHISITTPENGISVSNGHVTIEGVSEDIASLLLNGHQIFTDAQGRFHEDLLLLDGYNVIEMQATDKFKRTVTKRLDLVLLSSAAPVAMHQAVMEGNN